MLEGFCVYYVVLCVIFFDYQCLIEVFEVFQVCYVCNDQVSVEEGVVDVCFYLVIVEVSYNIVLLYIIKGLFDLLWCNVVINIGGMYVQCMEICV